MVVMASIILTFVSNNGILNELLKKLGLGKIDFNNDPNCFYPVYIASGILQGVGWGSIIYMAALTGISPELHEAAMIDGATKLQRILHVDLPGIMPTMIILLIMRSGSIMSVGFEKVYLMQNSLNSSVSEVIATYTYKQGMQSTKYSYSAAVGLFNNVINFVFLTLVNEICKRLGETSLW